MRTIRRLLTTFAAGAVLAAGSVLAAAPAQAAPMCLGSEEIPVTFVCIEVFPENLPTVGERTETVHRPPFCLLVTCIPADDHEVDVPTVTPQPGYLVTVTFLGETYGIGLATLGDVDGLVADLEAAIIDAVNDAIARGLDLTQEVQRRINNIVVVCPGC